MTARARRPLAVAAIALVLALAGCGGGGSSDGAAPAGSSTTAADTPAGSAADTPGDPCDLYGVDAMASQMGVDDVTAEDTTGVSPTCTYSSDAHYLKAELSVLDEEQMANTPRDPTAFLTGEAAGTVELLEVSGLGDEVFGSTTKGGATLVVRTGDTGYSLLLTNAGGGAESGNWTDEAAMVTSAKSILGTVIGG